MCNVSVGGVTDDLPVQYKQLRQQQYLVNAKHRKLDIDDASC
jgi:hypothetical protein